MGRAQSVLGVDRNSVSGCTRSHVVGAAEAESGQDTRGRTARRLRHCPTVQLVRGHRRNWQPNEWRVGHDPSLTYVAAGGAAPRLWGGGSQVHLSTRYGCQHGELVALGRGQLRQNVLRHDQGDGETSPFQAEEFVAHPPVQRYPCLDLSS